MFAAGIPLVSAALSVAFPGEGQSLPAVERTYVIGAVSVSNAAPLVVNGATTDVWRTGAFLAMVPVKPGKIMPSRVRPGPVTKQSLMVSFSKPVRRMVLMASSTV